MRRPPSRPPAPPAGRGRVACQERKRPTTTRSHSWLPCRPRSGCDATLRPLGDAAVGAPNALPAPHELYPSKPLVAAIAMVVGSAWQTLIIDVSLLKTSSPKPNTRSSTAAAIYQTPERLTGPTDSAIEGDGAGNSVGGPPAFACRPRARYVPPPPFTLLALQVMALHAGRLDDLS